MEMILPSESGWRGVERYRVAVLYAALSGNARSARQLHSGGGEPISFPHHFSGAFFYPVSAFVQE